MLLKQIKISNFKSISHLNFEVKKHGNSYTSMFVGINEVGKSNILQAMSFLETPTEEFNFLDLNNQNNDKESYIDIYFEFEFENDKTYLTELKKKMIESDTFLKLLNIQTITKNVYLNREKTVFEEEYRINLGNFKLKDYFYLGLPTGQYKIKLEDKLKKEEVALFEKLDEDKLNEILINLLYETIKEHENKVSFWKPEKEYLITEPINLQTFKDNPLTNIPLKNIFVLSKYKTDEEIKTKIEEIINNHSLRRGLQSTLSKNATKYFGNVWKHEIEIDIEISETLMCNVHIKDKGKANENKFFNMNSRSQGFHQFASLILSLSIQHHSLDMRNRLILIDEPENHLHPSGIRDIMEELLKIGENNYVFLATHSCFMIDKKTKQRNFIIKKDNAKNTIHQQISEDSQVIDDEVLREAFGINIYKDFLSPYKLLVEGLSDKKIIEKTLAKLKVRETILITNGYGDNIVSVASRLNYEDISPLVILDDDESGKKNREKIVKIGSNFTDTNVLTLKDLESHIVTGGTIEDLLGKAFVESKFKEQYNLEFEKEPGKFSLDEITPFVKQIKIYLQKNENGDDFEKFLEDMKTKIAEDFRPTIVGLDGEFPLLKSAVEKIVEQLGAGTE
jgi:predicted ATP-dependent endonuclease of OLD family